MIETPEDYQKLATRTLNEELDYDEVSKMLALGLAGEAGEVADMLKKAIYHEHPLTQDELAKELGDVLWYLSNLAYICGIPLTQIMELNIEKLQKRYPKGFSFEDSLKRVDVPTFTRSEDMSDQNMADIDKLVRLTEEYGGYEHEFERLGLIEKEVSVPYVEMQTESGFIDRLWYFVTNPFRYLIYGNVKW